jgi:hypothetical protein
MATPTPGATNSTGTLGFVGDTHFSVDRGFFSAPFTVAITTSTPGAQIRYTLDGTPPTATTGTIYAGPISITTTKTLRAAAFKTGWTPTDVDTQTYIFLADVIHQTGTGLPSFANWGHNGPDWVMDPNVVNNPTYSGTIINDLKAVPSVSLVMPWNDWFGSGGQGIYISGSGVERATSMEMISANDPTENFQSDAAVEIQGASSTQRWNEDKLSLRLTFKPPFGPTKLDQAMFTDPTFDQHGATKFDRLILDAMYDDSWMDPSSTNRAHAKMVQDQFAADLENLAGGHGPHGRFVQLYLNGLYWGMYYLHEEPDDSYAESYLGGDKSDYDVVKHNGTTVVAGDNTAASNFASLLTAVRKDMTVQSNFNAVAGKLDIDEFIDYMIVNQYVDNTDWASHNWYASFNRVDPAGRWRFHSWDAEISLRDVNGDVTTKNDTGSPTEIQTRLAANPEYRLRFADAAQRLLFNGGVLANAGSLYAQRANQIDRAIVGESARWGDNHASGPRLFRSDWRSWQDNLLANYFPQRGNILLGQYQARGWLASLGAPTFNQYGGTVNPGFQLTMAKPAGSPAGGDHLLHARRLRPAAHRRRRQRFRHRLHRTDHAQRRQTREGAHLQLRKLERSRRRDVSHAHALSGAHQRAALPSRQSRRCGRRRGHGVHRAGQHRQRHGQSPGRADHRRDRYLHIRQHEPCGRPAHRRPAHAQHLRSGLRRRHQSHVQRLQRKARQCGRAGHSPWAAGRDPAELFLRRRRAVADGGRRQRAVARDHRSAGRSERSGQLAREPGCRWLSRNGRRAPGDPLVCLPV